MQPAKQRPRMGAAGASEGGRAAEHAAEHAAETRATRSRGAAEQRRMSAATRSRGAAREQRAVRRGRRGQASQAGEPWLRHAREMCACRTAALGLAARQTLYLIVPTAVPHGRVLLSKSCRAACPCVPRGMPVPLFILMSKCSYCEARFLLQAAGGVSFRSDGTRAAQLDDGAACPRASRANGGGACGDSAAVV